jgi:hypothetical protein
MHIDVFLTNGHVNIILQACPMTFAHFGIGKMTSLHGFPTLAMLSRGVVGLLSEAQTTTKSNLVLLEAV